ncbi:hypothetical protein ACLMNJ_29325, partial [Streptomyces seoulensis]
GCQVEGGDVRSVADLAAHDGPGPLHPSQIETVDDPVRRSARCDGPAGAGTGVAVVVGLS